MSAPITIRLKFVVHMILPSFASCIHVVCFTLSMVGVLIKMGAPSVPPVVLSCYLGALAMTLTGDAIFTVSHSHPTPDS